MKVLQKKYSLKRVVFAIFLLIPICSTSKILAQSNYSVLDNWSIGVKFGSNHYSGDLSSNYLFFPSVNVDGRNGTVFGGFITKRVNKTFCATLDADFVKLHDTGNTYYKDYFNSSVFQINLIADADLFYVFFDASSRIKILPYMGMGLTSYHTSVYSRTSDQLMRDTSYDSSIGMSSINNRKNIAISIPIGLKVTQRLFENFEIGADFRVNNSLTDKLDGTVGGDNSNIYKGGLSLDKIPQNSWYDAWGYLGVSASYKIPPVRKGYIKNSRYL